MPFATENAGTIDIRDRTWRWSLLDPDREAPVIQSRDRWMFVRFRRPGDPRCELRALVPAGLDELSDDDLRELFEKAWAVSR